MMPGRKFSQTTSDCRTRSYRTSRPRSRDKSSASDFLFRLIARKYADSPSGKNGGPIIRIGSPPSGSSILTTSAPMSASSIEPYGPASMRERSRTRTPSKSFISAPIADGAWLPTRDPPAYRASRSTRVRSRDGPPPGRRGRRKAREPQPVAPLELVRSPSVHPTRRRSTSAGTPSVPSTQKTTLARRPGDWAHGSGSATQEPSAGDHSPATQDTRSRAPREARPRETALTNPGPPPRHERARD